MFAFRSRGAGEPGNEARYTWSTGTFSHVRRCMGSGYETKVRYSTSCHWCELRSIVACIELHECMYTLPKTEPRAYTKNVKYLAFV